MFEYATTLEYNAMTLAVTRTSDLAPVFQAPIESSGIPWWANLATLVIIGGMIAAYVLITRMRVPSMCIVDDLTLELCRGHRIGVQHRAILDHIAKLAQLEHTADLFLSAKHFDQAVESANQAKRFRGGQRGLIFEVRQCIFG